MIPDFEIWETGDYFFAKIGEVRDGDVVLVRVTDKLPAAVTFNQLLNS